MRREGFSSVRLLMGLAITCLAQPAFAQFDLALEADPPEGGVVASSENSVGDTVVTATPNEGYVFVGWEGDIVASESSMTFPLVADTMLVAVFDVAPPPQFTLTAFVDPSGAGTIVRDPAEFTYDEGSEVTLMAFAGDGFVFSGWTGDLPEGADATDSTLVVSMDGDLSIQATFAAGQELTDDGMQASSTTCGAMGVVSPLLLLSMMLMLRLNIARR